MTEFSDKIDAETKGKVEGAVERVKEALKGENQEEIKSTSEDLTQIWHQASAELYQQTASAEQGEAPTGDHPAAHQPMNPPPPTVKAKLSTLITRSLMKTLIKTRSKPD